MTNIGFTGTRRGLNERQTKRLQKVLTFYVKQGEVVDLHHGDCIGADQTAHEIARELGLYIVLHPPVDDKYRAWCLGDLYMKEKEYLKRNRAIVDACQFLIACPGEDTEVLRSGTWHTIRYAMTTGKKVILITPTAHPRNEDGRFTTVDAEV